MPHHIDRNLIQFLVVILFFAGGAIVNWLKRKGQSEQPPDASSERKFSPPPARAPRPTGQPVSPATASRPTPRKIDWEAELRRMLGEPETAPPPLPPRPVHQESRPAPTPPPVLPRLPTPRPAPIRPVVVEQERGLPVEFAGLTDSAQSHARASQLDVQVADHLRQVSQQVQRHAPRPKADVASRGVAQTLALLRNQQGLRSVIMASIILGPPKSLGG